MESNSIQTLHKINDFLPIHALAGIGNEFAHIITIKMNDPGYYRFCCGKSRLSAEAAIHFKAQAEDCYKIYYPDFPDGSDNQSENRRAKILILCTGNSCRSQMAAGFLKSFDPNMIVRSAGTRPAHRIHPHAVTVMKEVGIDISAALPEPVSTHLDEPWDFVITVCDNAKETCPIFSGQVKRRLHMGFEDPANASGSQTDILAVFRKVRDEIARDFKQFYQKSIKQ